MERQRKEDKIGGISKGIGSQYFDPVEAGVDTAIDSTEDVVHELRGNAEKIVDHTMNRILDRLMSSWERQRPRIEEYMASHPWMVLGGLLLLGYLFAGSQRKAAELRIGVEGTGWQRTNNERSEFMR